MKLKMAKNSLFAILLRSPWWLSFVLAGAMAAVARLVLPQAYEAYALFSAVPFVAIGLVAAWKQHPMILDIDPTVHPALRASTRR